MIRILFAAVLLLSPLRALAADAPCAALAQASLRHVQVTSAALVPAGTVLSLGGAAQASAPAEFCRVVGVASPVAGSHIGFELWLPAAARWNGKYLQRGNGAFAGEVPLADLLDGVRRGYAVAGTDGGHASADHMTARWAFNQPQALIDFGWRAVTETNRAARALVARHYRKAPGRAYFVGCSDGGRDAMVAAQRLPRAFNGIIAGAPALDWTGLMSAGAQMHQRSLPPSGALDVTALKLLQAGALAACSRGGAYVEDPRGCRFDPATLGCAAGQAGPCLTPAQVALANLVYHGLPEPGTGKPALGLEPGAEAALYNWDFWVLAQPQDGGIKPGMTRSIPEDFFRWVVRGDPQFTAAALTPADLVKARGLASTLNADSADLSAFRKAGGRLIQYHGWSDAAIPPRATLAYHDAAQAKMGPSGDFYRLFMVPGMNHCAGGNGPWATDWLASLEGWVEKGQAPERIAVINPRTRARAELVVEP